MRGCWNLWRMMRDMTASRGGQVEDGLPGPLFSWGYFGREVKKTFSTNTYPSGQIPPWTCAWEQVAHGQDSR